ncbi:MAG: hypothetical protein AB1847_23350 [bacterium]
MSKKYFKNPSYGKRVERKYRSLERVEHNNMPKEMISPENASIPIQDAPAVDLLAKIALFDQKANDLRAEIPYKQINQMTISWKS